LSRGGQSEKHHEKRTKTRQEDELRQKSGYETTLAPATNAAASDPFGLENEQNRTHT
jgi:hypothetical protein